LELGGASSGGNGDASTWIDDAEPVPLDDSAILGAAGELTPDLDVLEAVPIPSPPMAMNRAHVPVAPVQVGVMHAPMSSAAQSLAPDASGLLGFGTPAPAPLVVSASVEPVLPKSSPASLLRSPSDAPDAPVARKTPSVGASMTKPSVPSASVQASQPSLSSALLSASAATSKSAPVHSLASSAAPPIKPSAVFAMSVAPAQSEAEIVAASWGDMVEGDEARSADLGLDVPPASSSRIDEHEAPTTRPTSSTNGSELDAFELPLEEATMLSEDVPKWETGASPPEHDVPSQQGQEVQEAADLATASPELESTAEEQRAEEDTGSLGVKEETRAPDHETEFSSPIIAEPASSAPIEAEPVTDELDLPEIPIIEAQVEPLQMEQDDVGETSIDGPDQQDATIDTGVAPSPNPGEAEAEAEIAKDEAPWAQALAAAAAEALDMGSLGSVVDPSDAESEGSWLGAAAAIAQAAADGSPIEPPPDDRPLVSVEAQGGSGSEQEDIDPPQGHDLTARQEPDVPGAEDSKAEPPVEVLTGANPDGSDHEEGASASSTPSAAPDVDSALAPTAADIRSMLEGIVDGRHVDPSLERLALRTIVAIFLEEGLFDNERLEQGLASVARRDRSRENEP
jgi:hypothetical protein